jgi:hypothetical protein
MTVTGTTITGNHTGDDGAGVSAYDSDVTITDSMISGNTADRDGGALYLYGATATVSGSTISGNTAAAGSAASTNYASDLTVANSTVTGNGSDGAVFALNDYTHYLYPGSASFDHVTMAGNTGIAGVSAVNALPITVVDSILYGTTAGADLQAPGSVTATYSLFGATGDVAGGSGGNVVGVDPLLGALADNGGPTTTMLPAATSPVLDAGDPAYSATTLDQRGEARVATVGAGTAVTDMGAVEVAAADYAGGSGGGGGGGAGGGTDAGAGGGTAGSGAGGAGGSGSATTPTTTGTTTGSPAATAATATSGPEVSSLASTGTDTSLLLPLGGGLIIGGGVLTLLGARFRRRRVTGAGPIG